MAVASARKTPATQRGSPVIQSAMSDLPADPPLNRDTVIIAIDGNHHLEIPTDAK